MHRSLPAAPAWVAAQTAGDALLGSFYRSPIRHVGLWGGAVEPGPSGPRLNGYRFVVNAAATGRLTQHAGNGVIGTITIHYRGADYPVHVSWSQRSRFARATIPGATLKLPAPGP
jgi:hypothetical protein